MKSRNGNEKTSTLSIWLSIKGFDCDPEEITSMLGIEPTQTYRKGELIGNSKRRAYSQNIWHTSWSLLESSMEKTTKEIRYISQKLKDIDWDKELCISVYDEGLEILDIFICDDLINAISLLNCGLGFDLHFLYDIDGSEKSEFEVEVLDVFNCEIGETATHVLADSKANTNVLHRDEEARYISFLDNYIGLLLSSNIFQEDIPQEGNKKRILLLKIHSYGGDNSFHGINGLCIRRLAELDCAIRIRINVIPPPGS